MALTVRIECDRCGTVTNIGTKAVLDRVAIGIGDESLNVNEFGDRREWAVCTKCDGELREFLKGVD